MEISKVTLKSGEVEKHGRVGTIFTSSNGTLWLETEKKGFWRLRDIVAAYAPGEWIKVECIRE